ncbi:DNA helicase PIF1, ATP-dependent [Tanacetum coccineum]
MSKGSWNRENDNPSLASILHRSIQIHSYTIINRDGKVQSFCGLKITNINTPCPGIPVSYHSLGPASYQCPNYRANMWHEERTNKARRAGNPTFSICCQDGKVKLSKFHEAPPPLNKLLDYTDPATLTFRDKIRVYNSMFCFTSFGARIDHSINTGRGLYTFRINGQNYHRIGYLLLKEGVQPRYAQLYFFDTNNEVQNRMSAFIDKETTEGIDPYIVQRLIEMLNQSSLVAKAFLMVKSWCHSHSSTDVQLKLLGDRSKARQYNKPTMSEVAALITNDFGDVTWHFNTLYCSHMAKMATMKKYRTTATTEGTTLLRGGRLFQQYLVDAYTAVEEQRLKWIRNNQDTLHVDLYHNVCDAITRGDTNAKGLGKRIILPWTFTGGPRYIMQNYQDAMALCRTYGNPDLFITFTSNPKWPEITKILSYMPGQKAHDRPEIGTHVFKMKLTALLEDLTRNKIFGACRADVYVIEFQNMDSSMRISFYGWKNTTNGYPIYRRRDNKASVVKGKFKYDNGYVVPHNRYLLLKYKAHVNVEWCNRSKEIKYLFKYLNKGPDRATVVIQEMYKLGMVSPQIQSLSDEAKFPLDGASEKKGWVFKEFCVVGNKAENHHAP